MHPGHRRSALQRTPVQVWSFFASISSVWAIRLRQASRPRIAKAIVKPRADPLPRDRHPQRVHHVAHLAAGPLGVVVHGLFKRRNVVGLGLVRADPSAPASISVTPSLRSRFFTASGSYVISCVKKYRPSLRISEKTFSRSPSARMTASIRAPLERGERLANQGPLPSETEPPPSTFCSRGKRPHPLPLDPEQLVLVVAGGRAIHLLEREFLDQLPPGEHLLRGVVTPAQPRQSS